MRRAIFVATLVLPAAFLCVALAPSPVAPSPLAPPCDNLYAHEPVLLYEVSGPTLCCTIDLQLTVFGDGAVRIASADAADGRARMQYVSPLQVQGLLADLASFGAGTACDVPSFFSDVPLSTLTLMRGTTEGRARTWSWLGDDGHGNAIQARIDGFVQQTFPGF